MANFWYPNNCSDGPGCILCVDNTNATLVGIARTCQGHASLFSHAVQLRFELGQIVVDAANALDHVGYATLLINNRLGIKASIPVIVEGAR